MPVAGWIGGGISGTGSAMQFMAQRKREAAQNRVQNDMKNEEARYGQEQFDVSDTLRKALDSIAQQRTGLTSASIANRNSPQRELEAQQVEQQRVQASRAGMNQALAALQGPSNAYRGADGNLLPGDAIQGQGAGGNGSALDQSTAVYGNRVHPALKAALDQLAAQGHLTGAANFDTQNQQQLAMAQRPLDNQSLLRQLLTGVRQGENTYAHSNAMNALQQAMEHANKTGSNEMLWGSILQNIGTGIAGGTDFKYSSPNGANNPGATPQEGQQPMNSGGTSAGGGSGTGGDVEGGSYAGGSLSMPYNTSDYVPNYGPGFASNGAGQYQPQNPGMDL